MTATYHFKLGAFDCIAIRDNARLEPIGQMIAAEVPPMVWNIDSFPEETVAARRRLLQRAAAEQALIFGPHLAFPGLGYVRPQGSGWAWQAVE